MVLAAAWFLRAQDEKFWSYKLLNLIPGPTRGYPCSVREYEGQGDCLAELLRYLKVQSESWELPEVKEDINKFGGLRSVTNYALLPCPVQARTDRRQRLEMT